jgi:hypothetical protein
VAAFLYLKYHPGLQFSFLFSPILASTNMAIKGSDTEKEIGKEEQFEHADAHDAAARGHLATDE